MFSVVQSLHLHPTPQIRVATPANFPHECFLHRLTHFLSCVSRVSRLNLLAMRQLLIGIDSGTQSTKALVVDAKDGRDSGY